MATVNCTAVKAAPASKGQGVVVNVSGAEALSVFPLISVGNLCTVSSSAKTGYIYSIDRLGHSFIVTPPRMPGRFDSDTPGVLKNNELITITY